MVVSYEEFTKQDCPKGGKHDIDLGGHSSGGISDWAGMFVYCIKCDAKNGEMVNLKTGEKVVIE